MRSRCSSSLWFLTAFAATLSSLIVRSPAGEPGYTRPAPHIRDAKGEEFVNECMRTAYSLFLPNIEHCPSPGWEETTGREENSILLERLPQLGGRERQAALRAMAVTAGFDDSGRTIGQLKELWAQGGAAERIYLLAPIVSAMRGAKDFGFADGLVGDLGAMALSPYNVVDFQSIEALKALREPDLQVATRRRFVEHLEGEITAGSIGPFAMGGALHCAKSLGSEDAKILLMIQAIEDERLTSSGEKNVADRVNALNSLGETGGKGVAALCELVASEHGEVGNAARKTYEKLIGTDAPASLDSFYLGLLRVEKKSDNERASLGLGLGPMYKGDVFLIHARGATYFGLEAKRDLPALAKRLKDAGVVFSQDEMKFLSDSVPQEFIRQFPNP